MIRVSNKVTSSDVPLSEGKHYWIVQECVVLQGIALALIAGSLLGNQLEPFYQQSLSDLSLRVLLPTIGKDVFLISIITTLSARLLLHIPYLFKRNRPKKQMSKGELIISSIGGLCMVLGLFLHQLTH